MQHYTDSDYIQEYLNIHIYTYKPLVNGFLKDHEFEGDQEVYMGDFRFYHSQLNLFLINASNPEKIRFYNIEIQSLKKKKKKFSPSQKKKNTYTK